jgi:hypothetical protein
MHRYLTGLAVLSISLAASLQGSAKTVGAGQPGSVTAIDILLEPDATMIRHAEAANARLRKSFPFRSRSSVFCSAPVRWSKNSGYQRARPAPAPGSSLVASVRASAHGIIAVVLANDQLRRG